MSLFQMGKALTRLKIYILKVYIKKCDDYCVSANKKWVHTDWLFTIYIVSLEKDKDQQKGFHMTALHDG